LRTSRRPIRIASRQSKLARAQTLRVGKVLEKLYPNTDVQYVWLDSEGDQADSVPLYLKGGKGLFARRIEQALLNDEADLAVHSYKDLPVDVPTHLSVVAVPPRADVRDCFITHHAISHPRDLPPKAVVGTASPRRAAQLLTLRPDLRIKLLRGNIETRLAKVLDSKTFDATLLAVAGLTRAGLKKHAALALDVDLMLPAACQGALALQCRSDDHVTFSRVATLNHAPSSIASSTEREVVAAMQADCHSPIAVLATMEQLDVGQRMTLRARIVSPDGKRIVNAIASGPTKRQKVLVKDVVEQLKAAGGIEILHAAATP